MKKHHGKKGWWYSIVKKLACWFHLCFFKQYGIKCSIYWIYWNQKLKLQTKIFFVGEWCKWKFDNFLIHFWRKRTRKYFFRRGKNFLYPSLICITKTGFQFFVLVYPMDRTIIFIKFSHCEKATKFEKNHIFLYYTL